VAPKKAIVKKDVKSKVAAKRNGCDCRLIAKILTTTIQANLCYLLHISLRFGTKSLELSLLKKIFAINLPSQPFLGHHLGFHIFFHNGLLEGCTLFLQLG